ncbi:MAG: signal recognition particle-docking protein FtsY [Actinomycetota bacterium]
MSDAPILELVLFIAALFVIGIFFYARRPKDRPPEQVLEEEPSRDRDVAADVVVEERPDDTALEPEVAQEPDGAPEIVHAPPRPTLRERLGRSRKFLSERLSDVFGGGMDDEVWEDLEAILIQSDVGAGSASKITQDVRDAARTRKVTDEAGLRALLADELATLFDTDADRALSFGQTKPSVWMVVGVNGTGKTTTIGKLASDLRDHERTVALAASDTFRAAANEQLSIWADRSAAQLVQHQPGADPGAVAFDAYRFARARNIDVLIVDTAGRLHTKTPLMEELSKVRRVLEKEGQVDEVLLVIDATAGQNGLVQAREFAQASGVTGIVLTKLDGSAKGGIALAIERELGIPIKLIGVGEGADDLEPFDPKTFVDALLG